MGSQYIKSPKFQKKSKNDPETIKKIEKNISIPLTGILEKLENFFYNMIRELTKQGLSPLQAQGVVCQHIDDYIKGLESIKKSIREK